jgi:hypothetical protein
VSIAEELELIPDKSIIAWNSFSIFLWVGIADAVLGEKTSFTPVIEGKVAFR